MEHKLRSQERTSQMTNRNILSSLMEEPALLMQQQRQVLPAQLIIDQVLSSHRLKFTLKGWD